MTAADDATMDYPTTPDAPSETVSESRPTWLDQKFTLEIYVGRLNGNTEKSMYYIFEPGEDDCTMGNALSRVKDMFPTPENQRPKL